MPSLTPSDIVVRMFHPTLSVPDLTAARSFFRTFFGREPIEFAEYLSAREMAITPGYPTDYCFFVPIADVFFDCVDPSRHIFRGTQRARPVARPTLTFFGWAVRDVDLVYSSLAAAGVRFLDQSRRPYSGSSAPMAEFAKTKLFWTAEEDTGLGYEFYAADSISPADPRGRAGWHVPPSDPKDPLGIRRCSHHTVITGNPGRALRIMVDILGGKVIHQAASPVSGTQSFYVQLADSIIEYNHDPAMDGVGPDSYVGITWHIVELDKVAGHLAALGIPAEQAAKDLIVAGPEQALGVRWGFTTATVPGDLRQS